MRIIAYRRSSNESRIYRTWAHGRPGSLTADLFTDGQLPADRADLIADALTALGVLVRVKILPRRRSASDLQWLVLTALPLQAFLTSIGGNFADDTYKGFQAAVRKLLHREQAAEQAAARPVVLQDTDSGLRIVLDHDLPADGYQQLLTSPASEHPAARRCFGMGNLDIRQACIAAVPWTWPWPSPMA